MKTNKLLLFALVTFQITSAQNNGIAVSDLKPTPEENKFPIISYTAKPKVAENINTFLQLYYLELLPGTYNKHPFENIAADRPTRFEDSHNTIGFFNWTQNPMPGNVLSLAVDCEYTGAYSEYSTNYHNFDTRTGQLIRLSSIIKKEQLKPFNKLLNDKVKQKVGDFLSTVKMELSTLDSIKDKEEFARHTEQIAMYNYCMEDNKEYQLEYYHFYFLQDSLHFVRERCSVHANRAIDDLYEMDMAFSYQQMDSYFSDYGTNLISTTTEIIQNENPAGKLFKGKMGNIPISAFIKEINTDGSLDMVYWYDKYKIPIEWNGKFTDNHFSLTEEIENDNYMIVANIEAQWNNDQITGTWTNNKTKQVLKLELKAY